VPQNDEKECGVWLNEEERTKVVVKVEVRAAWKVGRSKDEGSGEGGKGFR
jgi:hypothetical protein